MQWNQLNKVNYGFPLPLLRAKVIAVEMAFPLELEVGPLKACGTRTGLVITQLVVAPQMVAYSGR